MMKSDYYGILLAGGKSSRMGRDKAGLTLKGRTFLEIQIDKMKDLGLSDIFLSGKCCDLPGALSVPDVVAEKGPLGGLYSCFLRCEGRPALVLPVDLPLISVSTLSKIMEAFENAACDGLVLSFKGKTEPLIAVYNTGKADILKELLDSGDRAVSSFIRKIDYRYFEYEGDLRELLNCNTPEDLSLL